MLLLLKATDEIGSAFLQSDIGHRKGPSAKIIGLESPFSAVSYYTTHLLRFPSSKLLTQPICPSILQRDSRLLLEKRPLPHLGQPRSASLNLVIYQQYHSTACYHNLYNNSLYRGLNQVRIHSSRSVNSYYLASVGLTR